MTTLAAQPAPTPNAAAPSAPAAPVPGIAKLALALTYLASMLTPWNGIHAVGFRPGDIVLFLALMVFFLSDAGRLFPNLPGWVWQFGFIILFVTALHELIPTDPNYLANRLVVDTRGFRIPEIESNLRVGLKFVVPIIGLPLMYAFAYAHDRRALYRGALFFAIGTAISAFIGFTDGLGLTQISASITGLPAVSGRAPGLAVHPNFLATTCVLSLPLLLWQIPSPDFRVRVRAIALTLPILAGLYASGSRGGAAVGAGAVLLSFAIMPVYRRYLVTVALLVASTVGVIFIAAPSVGAKLLRAVRLGGGDTGSASGSDSVRSAVGHQGILDFQHSPLDGVGMQVAAEAHNVYLQALASGGIILTAGYAIFVLGGVYSAYKMMPLDDLAYPFFVSAVAGAILSTVENALVDRLAYVPLALIAAMASRYRVRQPDAPPGLYAGLYAGL